jgi:hypothetical protein
MKTTTLSELHYPFLNSNTQWNKNFIGIDSNINPLCYSHPLMFRDLLVKDRPFQTLPKEADGIEHDCFAPRIDSFTMKY